MKGKISIIIPFYNSQRYIKRCLDSIVVQTFKDFDVILIDDGSDDHSYQIARAFETKYQNFKILKQEHQGVAQARNLGLSESKGEFIIFVDSDDFVDKNYLHHLYYEAIRTKADIVCCNFYWFYFDRIAVKNYINYKSGLFSNIEALDMIVSDTVMQSYLWNKLWRRDLFIKAHIDFSQMYFEDISTAFKMVYYANKVVIINKALYYYTQRKGSILHEFSFETQNDYLRALMEIKCFLDTHNVYAETQKSFSFLCLKVKIVMISALFLVHKRQKSFHTLLYNYKRTFWFIKNCQGYVTEKKKEHFQKLILFR